MAMGPCIRKMFGPFERYVADAYRAIFFDVTEFVGYIKHSIPISEGLHILDLGCGEGAVTSLLAITFPGAYVTGSDINPYVSRLYHGDSSRIVFTQQTIEDIAVETPHAFDIVVISDVMHHVPREKHREFLIQVKKVLKPGGGILF